MAEEAPDPVPVEAIAGAAAAAGEEILVAPPPGPDRLHLEITDPTDAPCIIMLPKIFPFSGGHTIPKGDPVAVATVASLKDNIEAPTTDEFHLWYESMRYGIVHLQNYSMQDTDTLFTFNQIDAEPFERPDANTVKRFTIAVNFLHPTDSMYRTVTTTVLASKEKAMVEYGSKLAPRFTTPTKAPTAMPATTTPSVTPPMADDRYTASLQGLASAIIDQPNKTKTQTEREHDKEAKDNQRFYQIFFASTPKIVDADNGSTETIFKPAKLTNDFIEVVNANSNSKATKILQAAVEDVALEMNYTDNRFASASELKAELFDQPTTAAIRSGNWEHRHTVLHPDGIKTHFAFHHLAPPRTWAADYKTRMEGAIKVTQQEQVEEASSRTQAKATDLYHFGRMGSLSDINCMIGNFFCLMNTIIEYDANSPPAAWLEIVEFDTTMRSQEARDWFNHHRNLKELMFNVIQEITSNIAGFVAVARNSKYKKAIEEGAPISPDILKFAKEQGTNLRSVLRSIILTMQADRYSTAALVFKLFQPPETKK